MVHHEFGFCELSGDTGQPLRLSIQLGGRRRNVLATTVRKAMGAWLKLRQISFEPGGAEIPTAAVGARVATTALGLATRRVSATVLSVWNAPSSDGERFLSAKEKL